MDADFFWNNIKPIMKKNGFTQESFAQEIGVSYATLHGWIAKKIIPDLFSAYKIANTLNVTLENLVTGNFEDYPKASNNELKITLEKMLNLINYAESHNTPLSDIINAKSNEV